MAEENKLHGLAGPLLHLFKGKKVEINLGETAITMNYDDHSVDQKALVRGVLKDAIGDALIIDCEVFGKVKQVIVNCWSVNTVTEVDDVGTTKSIYYNEGSKRLRRAQK